MVTLAGRAVEAALGQTVEGPAALVEALEASLAAACRAEGLRASAAVEACSAVVARVGEVDQVAEGAPAAAAVWASYRAVGASCRAAGSAARAGPGSQAAVAGPADPFVVGPFD